MSLFGSTPQPSNPPGLFGSSTPSSAPSGGLFGSTTPAAHAPSGGLFGSSTPATSAPAPGGLFGSSTTPATSAGGGGGGGGGLFGATTSTPGLGGGGLFGSTPAATSAPAPPGLYGSTGASTAGGGGGLFGGTAASSSTTPAPGGGLFGGSMAGGAPAAGSGGGGLFGNTGAAATSTSKPSLFGSTPATAPPGSQPAQAGGGLFGGTGLFGGQAQQQQQQQQQQQPQPQQQSSLFGVPSQGQGQQMVPAATIDASKLTSTTRFGDCHETVQRVLEELDKHFQDEIQRSRQLADRFSIHREGIESIPADASVLTHRLSTAVSIFASDKSSSELARVQHVADDAAATLSIRTLDLFRLPPAQRSQFIQRVSNLASSSSSLPPAQKQQQQRENDVTSNAPMVRYFNGVAEEMERRAAIVKGALRDVEEGLRAVEAQAKEGDGMGYGGVDAVAVVGGVGGRQDARRLVRTLRGFAEAMRDVAGRIAEAREGVGELKAKAR